MGTFLYAWCRYLDLYCRGQEVRSFPVQDLTAVSPSVLCSSLSLSHASHDNVTDRTRKSLNFWGRKLQGAKHKSGGQFIVDGLARCLDLSRHNIFYIFSSFDLYSQSLDQVNMINLLACPGLRLELPLHPADCLLDFPVSVLPCLSSLVPVSLFS